MMCICSKHEEVCEETEKYDRTNNRYIQTISIWDLVDENSMDKTDEKMGEFHQRI